MKSMIWYRGGLQVAAPASAPTSAMQANELSISSRSNPLSALCIELSNALSIVLRTREFVDAWLILARLAISPAES